MITCSFYKKIHQGYFKSKFKFLFCTLVWTSGKSKLKKHFQKINHFKKTTTQQCQFRYGKRCTDSNRYNECSNVHADVIRWLVNSPSRAWLQSNSDIIKISGSFTQKSEAKENRFKKNCCLEKYNSLLHGCF